MDLQHVLSALRRAWFVPALAVLLAGGAALATSLLIAPMYTAHMQLFVSTSASASTSDVVQSSAFAEQRAASYAEMIMGVDLAQDLVTMADLEVTPEGLAKRITAEAVPGTVLIDVSVADTSPQRAQLIAQAIAERFPRVVDSLETAVGGQAARTALSVVEPAGLPREPTSPNVALNVIAACLIGLLIGVVVVIVRERMDRTVKDVEQAETITGTPVLGVVSSDRALQTRPGPGAAVERASREDVRKLRTNLRFVNAGEPLRTLLVTSALPGEGKTTLAIELALAMAETNRKVLLLEADLRQPAVGPLLGLAGQVGLSEILTGTADIQDVLEAPAAGRFAVITAGTAPTDPGTVITSACMSALLATLREEYDIVVVDAPALHPVADAAALAPLVDGVLLVVRCGRTDRDRLAQATMELEQVDARLVGVVLNGVSPQAQVAGARERRREPRSAGRAHPAQPPATVSGPGTVESAAGRPVPAGPSAAQDASDHRGRSEVGDTADRL